MKLYSITIVDVTHHGYLLGGEGRGRATPSHRKGG